MAETRVIITAEANQAIQEFNRLRAEASGALSQIGGGAAQLNRVTISAAQTAFALRQVPAQFTDIVVSLQAGQNPLTVLLQQGGQLRDMFGSSGAAARALAGYVVGLINPYTVLAAGVAAVAVAYYQGSKEADAYTKAIVMSGNAAGVSKGQLADMAREIGKGSNTQGAAAQALAELVGTGKVARENLQGFALTALNVQRSVGVAVGETVKDFQELGKSPLEATLKLNEKYNYLTASVYEQIRALERKGDVDAAAEVAQKAYASAMDGRAAALKANLGTLESAWEWVGTKARKAWDGMLDIGREDTLAQKIEKVKKQIQSVNLEQMSFVGSSKENRAESDVRKQALKDQLAGLEKTQRAQADANAATAQANNLEQAKIKWLQDGEKYLTRQQQLDNAITKARAEGAAAGKSEQEINARVAQVAQSYSDIANDTINAQIEAIKRRGTTEDTVTRRSMDLLTMKHDVGLVKEEDFIRAVAQLDNAAFEKEKSRLAEELALTAKKQNSQKDQAALRGQISQVAVAQTNRQLQAENDLYALEVRNSRAAADNYANVFDKQQAATQQIREQLTAQQDANDQIGLTKKGVTDLAAARLEDRAALAEQNAEIAEGVDFSGKLSEQYRQQAKDLRDLAAAQRAGAVKQAVSDKFSPKDLEDFLDPAKAKSFGESLKDAFGGAGDALTKLRASLEDYGIAQQTIERARAAAAVAFAGDSAKLAAANATITKKEVQTRVGAYGDMIGAAKGFFGENTAGYKVLAAAEKAFRLYELGLAAESLAKKVLFKETEVAANVALNATKIGGEATASAASTALAGTEASAWGVTAVVKALASLPFPANIAAGAATLAAVIAVGAKIIGSLGGGGSVSTSEQRQAAQGTGSVLGDSTAKSDSLSRAIELAAANSSIELTHTSAMLASLKSIDSKIASFASLLVRTSGVTNPDVGTLNSNNGTATKGVQVGTFAAIGSYFGPIGTAIGAVVGLLAKNIPVLGKIATAIFGGKQSLEDSGITMSPAALADILTSGAKIQSYADIKTSGGWFSSDKTSTQKTDLSAEANRQISSVIVSMADGVKAAAGLLGIAGNDFDAKLNSFVVDLGEISLKGLSGDDLQKALEAVFSKLGDQMASFAVGGLEQFQKVGEGYLETLTRVATDYANLDSIMESIGATFATTGISSIAARENLIELAGGIDQLATQTNSFAENFLSTAEQLAPVQKYVTDQLAAMGLQSLDTRDKFKDYVLGLASSGALATDAGAQQYAALLALSDAFAKTHAATVDLTKSEQAIADERTDLQNKLDELTMTQAQLAEKARNAIDSHNLALYDQVIAAQAAKDAAAAAAEAEQTAAAAIKAAQESSAAAMAGFGNALVDSMNKAKEAAAAFRALNDALLVSDSSTLSPEQKYLEAKRQFESADQTNIQAAEKAFLDASKAWFGGSAGYAADFAAVISKNSQFAASNDLYVGNTLAYWQALKDQMAASGSAHENGGVASGWSLVGERGPEIVNFTEPGRVYTASQSREMMGGSVSMDDTNRLLREVLVELQADKPQRAAVSAATIEKLDLIADKVDAQKRAVRAKEAA